MSALDRIRESVARRLNAKVAELRPHPTLEKPCKIWGGCQTRGGDRPSSGPYGSIHVPGENSRRVHVVAAWLAGILPETRVPEGMNLDHVCRSVAGEGSTLCFEETHLELVTEAENHRRRWAR